MAILGRALASEWNRDGVEVLGGARREAGGAPMPQGSSSSEPAMAPGGGEAGAWVPLTCGGGAEGKRGRRRNPRARLLVL